MKNTNILNESNTDAKKILEIHVCDVNNLLKLVWNVLTVVA